MEEPAGINSGMAGEFSTRSAEETFELGLSLGEKVEARAIFLLSGDLGAGKTVLAKGLAAGLGVAPEEVTSPSFTLINVYEGRLRLYHIDLYRLDGGATEGLGLEEIFDEKNCVVVIEWAERLKEAPGDAIEIEISYVSESDRRIRIRGSE